MCFLNFRIDWKVLSWNKFMVITKEPKKFIAEKIKTFALHAVNSDSERKGEKRLLT